MTELAPMQKGHSTYTESNNTPTQERVWPHDTIYSVCQHKTIIVFKINFACSREISERIIAGD